MIIVIPSNISVAFAPTVCYLYMRVHTYLDLGTLDNQKRVWHLIYLFLLLFLTSQENSEEGSSIPQGHGALGQRHHSATPH